MNRVSEVLKARRVSRGYLGWTGWMPRAHWYGVPSLSCMVVCFFALVVLSRYLQVAACPRDARGRSFLTFPALPSSRCCCQDQSFPLGAMIYSCYQHEENAAGMRIVKLLRFLLCLHFENVY